MTPEQVDKAAKRLRKGLADRMAEDPVEERKTVLTAFDLAAGAARNLAVLASK